MKFPPPITLRWGWLNWPANLRRATTVVFLAFANWLFLAPAATFRDVHVFLSQQDKIAHFGIFGILSGLVRWSIPAVWGTGWRRALLFLALIAYGAAIECIQLLMPSTGRSFEWMDLLWDCIGIATGVLALEWLATRQKSPPGLV